ncbi:Ankyrin repeat protein 2 [Giardia muris]|uniref:Ankyrin repeat protein 2 n=1 Tax=Giardia muris TaxID=5742 RepID=A0A4Z1SYA6_GIAMU|nr:Ankyrin repeat protein 2 [Giardia muris]|eukprot:TNJ28488.1 Ankyrin repeat protein 2 [Giardia muris]
MADTNEILWFKAVQGGRHEDLKHHLPRFSRTRNREGFTALILAARLNDDDAVRILASREAGLTDQEGLTALMHAAIVDSITVVLTLAPKESGIKDKRGFTALMYAILHGHAKAIEALVPFEHQYAIPHPIPLKSMLCSNEMADKTVLNPLYTLPAGLTPVMFAVMTGNIEAVTHLEFTARTPMVDNDGRSCDNALLLAIRLKDASSTKALLKSANLCLDNGEYAFKTALVTGSREALRDILPMEWMLAIQRGWKTEILELLIDLAFDLDTIAVEKFTHLHADSIKNSMDMDGVTLCMAASSLNSIELLSAILDDNPAAPLFADKSGLRSIHYAARAGAEHTLRLLLSRFPYLPEVATLNPLTYAVRGGHYGCMIQALSYIKTQDAQGKSTLMHAIESVTRTPSNSQAARILSCMDSLLHLEWGVTDKNKRTALMLAVWNDLDTIAMALVEKEAGWQDKGGYTALMLFILTDSSNMTLLKALAHHEARLSLSMQFGGGKSALMLAIERRRPVDIIRSLSEVCTGLVDSQGQTALMYAVNHKYQEVIDVLLCEAGSRDAQGMTALMYAVRKGLTQIALTLLPLELGLRDHQGRTALIHCLLCQPKQLKKIPLWDEGTLLDFQHHSPLFYLDAAVAAHTATVVGLRERLVVYSVIHAPPSLFPAYHRFLLLLYTRITALADALLLRRRSSRQTSTTVSPVDRLHLQALRNHNTEVLDSPFYDAVETPVLRSWYGGLHQLAECLLSIFDRDDSDVTQYAIDLVSHYYECVSNLEEAPRPPRGDELYDDFCCVCMDEPVSVALLPCRHAVLCATCLSVTGRNCPVCRQEVQEILDLLY